MMERPSSAGFPRESNPVEASKTSTKVLAYGENPLQVAPPKNSSEVVRLSPEAMSDPDKFAKALEKASGESVRPGVAAVEYGPGASPKRDALEMNFREIEDSISRLGADPKADAAFKEAHLHKLAALIQETIDRSHQPTAGGA